MIKYQKIKILYVLNLIFEDNFIIILKISRSYVYIYIYIFNWILFVKIIKKIIFIENKLPYKNILLLFDFSNIYKRIYNIELIYVIYYLY